jgi:hypothetical protein
MKTIHIYQEKHHHIIRGIPIIMVILLSLFSSSIPAENQQLSPMNTEGTPDLLFHELQVYWGMTNTTGLFVDYGVINAGELYQSILPIASNLSFYADNSTSPFGSIIQTPFFYPRTWYPGEILGGNYFFEMESKPNMVTAKIDVKNKIPESNEENNVKTVVTISGIVVSGTVSSKNNNDVSPINEIMEITQYNETTLQNAEYRHFWTSEKGCYNVTLLPKKPYDQKYHYPLMVSSLSDDMKKITSTKPVSAGDHIIMNITLEGDPPMPPWKIFFRRVGLINRPYWFITSCIDPDEDFLWYKFKWDDGSYSPWLGTYSSSGIVWASHAWSTQDSYGVKIITKDSHGLLSPWSEPYFISIINLNRK